MGGYLSYDKVGKGKSALTTAVVLNLKAEVYVIFVFFAISVSHDIKNDFDSVDPHLLSLSPMEVQNPLMEVKDSMFIANELNDDDIVCDLGLVPQIGCTSPIEMK